MRRYYVVLAVPWYVRNVRSVEDACNIAVAEVGKRVPHFVEVDVASVICPDCGRRSRAVLVIAGDALVGVLLGLKVWADSEEGAVRVAKRIVGERLNTPLGPVSVRELEGGDGGAEARRSRLAPRTR